MRCVAGLGLLMLVGCNQVFGIAATREFDASIDVPEDTPHVVLDWQIAQVLPSGGPDPQIRFAPIVPAPRVRIAPLDGAFDVDAASYSPTDGWILIPRRYLGATWRLEYTLADGIPHEVQWAPADKRGHITVPVFGRIARTAPPAGSGYRISPLAVTAFQFPRVFTTGLWTEGIINNYVPARDGGTVDFDFFNAVSMNGSKGRPDPAQGDKALLVDFAIDQTSKCRIGVGAAALDSAALEGGVHTPHTPAWTTTTAAISSEVVGTPFLSRLNASLSKLVSTFCGPTSPCPLLSTKRFGISPHLSMPGITAAPTLLGAELPSPVMLTLLQCPYNVQPVPNATLPAALDAFVPIQHVQLAKTRQALGVTLTSGMATVLASAGAGVGFKMAFPAPLPTAISLTGPSGTVDLAGDNEQVVIGAMPGPQTLTFTLEAAADLRGDYFDVVLHKLTPGDSLAIQRIYTVTTPSVRIDGALLADNTDYVLEIRSYKGHPSAGVGDFAPVDYPYGTAVVFSRTFRRTAP